MGSVQIQLVSNDTDIQFNQFGYRPFLRSMIMGLGPSSVRSIPGCLNVNVYSYAYIIAALHDTNIIIITR